MNVVVLRGVLSRNPECRELASGSSLLQLDLSTPTATGVATVPVVWFDPPPTAQFAASDDVMVFGEVRRRFFRAGGSTQSRTEVVATSIVRASNRRAVSAFQRRVEVALASPGPA
jgi:single-strand DNA-binding protein